MTPLPHQRIEQRIEALLGSKSDMQIQACTESLTGNRRGAAGVLISRCNPTTAKQANHGGKEAPSFLKRMSHPR